MPGKKRKRCRLGSSVNACRWRRAEGPNDVWYWDFVFDRQMSGSQLRWLSVAKEYTRECPAPKVDRCYASKNVIDTRTKLFAMRVVSRHVRSASGPEFIAQPLRRWLPLAGTGTPSSEPGTVWRNRYAESIHGRFREGFTAVDIFHRVQDARLLTASLRDDYDMQRPDISLGYRTPATFAAGSAAFASAPAAHVVWGAAAPISPRAGNRARLASGLFLRSQQ